MTDNYYEFIGVKRDASVDDIKRACNKLLQKYHPDHYSEVHAEGTTKYINKIKDTLCDPEKRVAYNKTLFEEKSKAQEEKKKKEGDETEQKAKEKAEQRAWEEAQQKAEEERLHRRKEEERKKKGIFVFSLIFGVLLIGVVAMFLSSNGDSAGIGAIAGSASKEPSQSSDTYTSSIGMEFVKIPAGEFMMGSPSDEEGREDYEGPVHKVMIEESYYLGKFEVTQEQWREVMGNNPSYFTGDDRPVEKVSWDDVQEFIEKLNEMEGTNKYRLPSEAEWEYACRAGTTTRYSFGDDISRLKDYAWYDEDVNSGSTHPVGQKKPNPWGLYDMHGNVWEWVQDKHHDNNYDGAPSDGSAWEDGSSIGRVKRGGGWEDYNWYCRSAIRISYNPDSRYGDLGFRVLRKL